LNNNFICHIIRDVFPERKFTILYDRTKSLFDEMHTPLHGIGAIRMHSEHYSTEEQYYWPIGEADTYFGPRADLFISINYNPIYNKNLLVEIARQIKETMLPGGIVFIVNHDGWAEKLSDFLLVRSDLEKEVKRYSLFKGEDVRVYENI
jgi:hypothetical protein